MDKGRANSKLHPCRGIISDMKMNQMKRKVLGMNMSPAVITIEAVTRHQEGMTTQFAILI